MGLAANIVLGERYRLIRRLGRGGQSEVWLGERLATGQHVAIKAHIDKDVPDPVALQRFVREARAISQLRHPNTVRLFDFGSGPAGYQFMILEYIEGETLESWLKKMAAQGHVPNQAQIIDIGVQVLRALAEAHSLGIVHRDIKPANVMMQQLAGEAPLVRLVDFGIAWVSQSVLTGLGRSMGTPAYMSPEQSMGRPVDGRTDLYSLGLVLYRCAAGRPPFDGKPMQVISQQMTAEPLSLAETTRTPLSQRLVAAVHRALAKNPEERFATATEMRLALEAASLQPLAPLQNERHYLPVRSDGTSVPATSDASCDLSTEVDLSSPKSRSRVGASES
ncbi:MAG: serine/threonine protein kinase [Deltaproteobacteria bacterium]|nr:serine/threonine protein kinase [Deltaproteobacteria bacterium]